MKPYLLFSARQTSSRVAQKLIRPLMGADCLFSIYLRRLKRLLATGWFCDGAVALCPADKHLWTMAEQAGAPVLERDLASIEKGAPLNVIFGVLKSVEADNVLWVNACQPFLPDSRIFTASQHPRCTAYTTRSFVPVETPSSEVRSDKFKTRVYANSFHGFARRELLSSGQYWPNEKPELVPVPPAQCIDADEELDMEIIAALMRYRLSGEVNLSW
uniref:Cytidylyltransferase n=1 Tax=viral metagenome TaxID=1070528 RepID=A0A6H1ZGD6_9ZZZZ